MKNYTIYEMIQFIMNKISQLFCTHQCPVCDKTIRCKSKQFIEIEGKVKCTECQRHLEPIKIPRKL